MILANPRYTGQQVWNRQSTRGRGSGGRVSGRGSGAVRSNPAEEWEVSEHLTHRPLVDDATFLAVQGVRTTRTTKDGETRHYALAGLVTCGVCGRRMDANWVHGEAWVPLSSRVQQCSASPGGRAAQCLCARRPPP
jgi:hypothetical protein